MTKVFCYVTRNDNELLVFTHAGLDFLEAGLQVPAGTAREGEDLGVAALREAIEETGLDMLTSGAPLGTTDWDFRPARDEVHVRHFFHFTVQGPTPDRWTSQEQHDGLAPPAAFELFWLPIERGHVLSGGHSALLGVLSERLRAKPDA